MISFKGITLDPNFQKKSEVNFSKAQRYVDTKCIELMEDYVPVAMPRFKNRGKMSRSHKIEKPGVVINTEPEARREYYINKGGAGGKHGKLWLDRMKADRGHEILRGLKR